MLKKSGVLIYRNVAKNKVKIKLIDMFFYKALSIISYNNS